MSENSMRSISTLLVILFAAGLLLGIGLCGLSFVLPSSDSEFHTNWLSGVSLLLMLISFLGLIVTAIVRLVVFVIGRFSAKEAGSE